MPPRLVAAGVALGLGLACSGARPAPTPPPAPVAVRKQLAPLAVRGEAGAPSQAVILGTDEQDGSTFLPLPGVAAEAAVDAMTARGLVEIRLHTAPRTDGTVHHAIPGPLWASAAVAASALGKDLVHLGFHAAPRETLEDDAASGLVAAGFVAAVTGAAIDRTATLAGAVLPDGTLAPVAALPERFRAALARGKKRLGFPRGQRLAAPADAGAPVDLVALARAAGAEAVELATVHDAYRLITGAALPAAVPVPEADLALDDDARRALDEACRAWRLRLATHWATVLQLPQSGDVPPALRALGQRALVLGEAAEQLHARGALAAAHAALVDAWIFAAAAARALELIQRVQDRDLRGALDAAGAILPSLDRGLGDRLRTTAAQPPATVGDHLRVASAFQAVLRGLQLRRRLADELPALRAGLEQLADLPREELAAPRTADRAARLVAPVLLLGARADAAQLLTDEQLAARAAAGPGYTCAPAIAAQLAAAARAPLVALGQHLDGLVGTKDHVFTPYHAPPRGPEHLAPVFVTPTPIDPPHALWQEGAPTLAWSLASIATDDLATRETARFVAELYVLPRGATRADAPPPVALDERLASADAAARAHARAARVATGAIPLEVKLAYQLARAKRDGTAADRLDALAAYAAASASARLAVTLARN